MDRHLVARVAPLAQAISWTLSVLLAGCASPPAPAPPAASVEEEQFRLKLCSEAPIRVAGPPGASQSRGCVATFDQELADEKTRARLGVSHLSRRYLVYVPEGLASAGLGAPPVPVLFMFPASTASAEGAAFYHTRTRFEELADQDGFIVVYGNGVPEARSPEGPAPMDRGGFFPGCLLEHEGEGYDVAYVRTIVSQLETELNIDRSRIYATGLSQGGGLSLQLALEAPDLVAAIAPVAPVPVHPSGPWLYSCHPKEDYERVSIAMLAATHDPFVAYAPGGSTVYPDANYPGMEETRDAWLAALQVHGPPEIDFLPDKVQGDSFTAHTDLDSSKIERERYPTGPEGQELWYYKAIGAGHWWPNPLQTYPGLWEKMGKSNQDIDFADEAWSFFKRHRKKPNGGPEDAPK